MTLTWPALPYAASGPQNRARDTRPLRSSGWVSPPEIPRLARDDVHIWRATLDQRRAVAERLGRVLCAEERESAERCRFPRDRQHFTVARGLLRKLLGAYLRVSPQRLRFDHGPNGKPFLTRNPGDAELRFNVSHSDGLALYAVTRVREIGVDLERLRRMPDAELIAGRCFSPREQENLRRLPEAARERAFFDCWTRKEAYSKALGVGLARGLDAFEVSLRPGEPARIVEVAGDPNEPHRWRLQALTPAREYTGAVAVEGQRWRLACFQLQPGALPSL